jgi:hypothetical protein
LPLRPSAQLFSRIPIRLPPPTNDADNHWNPFPWPARFPIARVLIAFFASPLFANVLLLLHMDVESAAHPGPGDMSDAVLRDLFGMPSLIGGALLAALYSPPGYLAFAVLGLPALIFFSV